MTKVQSLETIPSNMLELIGLKKRDSFQNIEAGDGLAALDLVKDFGTFRAVDFLNFTVRNRECFGLLGINGAGKTTTFR